jgi:sortase A
MKRRFVLAALLFLLGLSVALIPTGNRLLSRAREEAQVKSFVPSRQDDLPDRSLYEALRQYNTALYAARQSELTSLDACADFPVDLPAYGREMIGTLSIPAIDVSLPLFLGASDDHLSRGAAVMGQTSAPIGGINTNCVIAGHRGWYGSDKLRYIDQLSAGDTVSVTNPWETMTYTVSEIRIIDPGNISAVTIQPGRDLVTLLTCHPYASGGKYRYLVFCERVSD